MTVLLPPEGFGYLRKRLATSYSLMRYKKTYPDPDGPNGSPETLVPMLVG
jgi:hypothetical protein